MSTTCAAPDNLARFKAPTRTAAAVSLESHDFPPVEDVALLSLLRCLAKTLTDSKPNHTTCTFLNGNRHSKGQAAVHISISGPTDKIIDLSSLQLQSCTKYSHWEVSTLSNLWHIFMAKCEITAKAFATDKSGIWPGESWATQRMMAATPCLALERCLTGQCVQGLAWKAVACQNEKKLDPIGNLR